MYDDFAGRVGLAHGLNLSGVEAGMDGAQAGPEHEGGLVRRFEIHGFPGSAYIEDMRVASGDAELAGGIAGQVLVRQEQHAVALAEGPVHHFFRVGRRAYRAAVAPSAVMKSFS